jgi:hypothetical protein
MLAQNHPIIFRYKHTEGAIATPKHFWMYQRGNSSIKPSPKITPYTIDFAKGRILFSETENSLEGIPFLYHAQFKQAKRLYTVSFAEAFDWARSQNRPQAPIFVCGMGRSGTTLLSRAFQRLNHLSIYDEPDVFTQLAAKPKMIEALLLFCTAAFQQDNKRLVLKQRSFVSFILRDMYRVFPDAKFLFLYRDAASWLVSNLRLILHSPIPERFVKPLIMGMFSDYLPKRDVRGLSLVETVVTLWLSFMEEAKALQAEGIPILPIHYSDFAANPTETLYKIFDYCALERDAVSQAAEAANEPSQAGTWLDDLPDIELNAKEIAQIEAMTAAYPKAFRL